MNLKSFMRIKYRNYNSFYFTHQFKHTIIKIYVTYKIKSCSITRFKNAGQKGFRDSFDPRFALALSDLNPDKQHYIKDCSVDISFNHAIGLYNAPGVEVSGNVIYNPLGSGIITESMNVSILSYCTVRIFHERK